MTDMTLATATDRLAELVAAAEHLAHVARGMGDAEPLRGLKCSEVEAIADVLRAVGADDAAETIVETHAYGDDDEEDAHHDQYLAIRAEHAEIDRRIAARQTAELLRNSRGDSERIEDAAQHFDAIADGRA